MTRLRWLMGIVFILGVSASAAAQSNWPEFRGPTADGKTSAKLPTKFNQENLNWSTPIHGKGWSSPVVWQDQIWLTTATEDGKRMSAICIDAQSGQTIRDLVIHENESPAFCHPTNSYASCTPAIESGRVYLHFGSYGTTCLDTKTGEQIWQRRDFECDHHRGPASSPILFENLLIVAFDGIDQQYVVALNKKTGETVWKTDRDIDYGTTVGDLMKAYGTGAVFDVDGQSVLVYPSAVATIAYQVRTGKPLWTCYHAGMNASARPLQTADGAILISNGMGKLVAVAAAGTGDVTDKILWTQSKGVGKRPSQILANDHVYMVSDEGIFTCLNTSTGESTWQVRVGGKYSASPISDGKNILVTSERGDVILWSVDSDSYQLVSKTKLDEGFKASPAMAGENVILRSFSKLYSFAAEK